MREGPLFIRTSERIAWLFLNQLPQMTPGMFAELLSRYGSAEAAARRFQDKAAWKAAEEEAERATQGDFHILLRGEADYPRALNVLEDAPPVLYVKGRWPLAEGLHIGIVGTRYPNAYGLQAAGQITEDLVSRGVMTVSGLAAGIDGAVHRKTLEGGGWTIAALGHGLKHRFPKENGELFERIGHEGTLMTEFPFNGEPASANFPKRNRLIAAFAKAIVVIEAGWRSGALITARMAAELGRDVCVVPGSIFEERNRGSHRLLRNGATLVESADDVLSACGFEPRGGAADMPGHSRADKEQSCSDFEKRILEALRKAPVSVDELALHLDAPIDRLANALLSLELRQLIQAFSGQRYGIP